SCLYFSTANKIVRFVNEVFWGNQIHRNFPSFQVPWKEIMYRILQILCCRQGKQTEFFSQLRNLSSIFF
ncbi:Protein of unknown function, partial [Gryllus bimaculatus]